MSKSGPILVGCARYTPFLLVFVAAISISQIIVSIMIKSVISTAVIPGFEGTMQQDIPSTMLRKTIKQSYCAQVAPDSSNHHGQEYLSNPNPNPPLTLDIPLPSNIQELLLHLRQIRQDQGRQATFVQIGANDGKMFDQLYPVTKLNKTAWIGLMVEPQPILYSKLILLHADAAPAWSFYQGVVIDSCDPSTGIVNFCETKTPGEGNFRTQGQLNGVRTSCDPATMTQMSRPCVKDYATLLEHGSRSFHKAANRGDDTYWVDILQIDTEGKDMDLIYLIDSTVLQFTCINFEHTYMGDPNTRPLYNQTMDHLRSIMGKMEYMRHSAGDTLACRVK